MKLKSFHKLFHMTKMINSRFELSEILQVLVDAIASEIAEADLVGFFMKQPNGTFRGYTGNELPVDITQLLINPEEDQFVKDILTKRAVEYIPDSSKDHRPDQGKVEMLKIKSLLGIPVIVDEEIYGLVFVHDFGKPMNITEEQIEVTEAFVNMASVAIHNIQMFGQTKRLLDAQQLMLDATNALSKSLSINDVLSTCFYYLEKTMGSQDIGIHLYNEQERILTPYHLSSTSLYSEAEWKGKHKQETIQLSIDNDLLFHEVVTKQKAVAISDVFADPRPNHHACKSFGIESLLVMPLVAKGSVFGVVAIPSIHKPKVFTENEMEFCQSIVDVTATALSNAIYAESLDSSVKQRTAELQQVNFKLEELVKELQFLNELKNDFIASLSHELRTPITAIKGSTDILRKGILGELSPAQKDLLETCNKAIERLLSQVNELLDFAKLESGRFELSYGDADIKQIIEEAIGILEPLIAKKKQKMIVDLDAQILLKIDRQRILQVLLNLVSNSNKFTPDGGEIRIKSYIEANKVIVEVHDTGIGIPLEKQKNIFTKFYQVNNQLNGTGLGLAISKQMIELHGGRIWFETDENKGSIFKFVLPIGNEDI